MLFTGEYEHTIDSKQRIAIPADIRSRMDKVKLGKAFYVVPGPNNSLWLWPEGTFEEMANALERTLMPGESMQEFDEITFPLARRVEIDAAGRIRLPEDILKEVNLGPGVTILGMRDHLELRDPQAWAQDRARKRARHTEIMLRARQAQALGQPPSTLGGGGERGS